MVTTEITINASGTRVWKVLTDFTLYPAWNPVITGVRGELTPGAQARISVKLRPAVPSFPLFVEMLEVIEGEIFSWRARVFSDWVFRADHHFRIQKNGKGAVKFIQSERYTGALAPLITLFLKPLSRRSFEAMDRCLKQECESGPAH